MSNYDLVKQAINEKKQIHCDYSGKKRFVCPHVLGKKNGTEQCFGYQFEGDSVTGEILPGSTGNWRSMKIADISNATLHDGPWHTAGNFDISTQTGVEEIDVAVEL